MMTYLPSHDCGMSLGVGGLDFVCLRLFGFSDALVLKRDGTYVDCGGQASPSEESSWRKVSYGLVTHIVSALMVFLHFAFRRCV